jgi:hypothetical protein
MTFTLEQVKSGRWKAQYFWEALWIPGIVMEIQNTLKSSRLCSRRICRCLVIQTFLSDNAKLKPLPTNPVFAKDCLLRARPYFQQNTNRYYWFLFDFSIEHQLIIDKKTLPTSTINLINSSIFTFQTKKEALYLRCHLV